ncbi:hypothetical protein KIPB_008493, partial [Kipferlia bialata]|eukprot:g8493.t1
MQQKCYQCLEGHGDQDGHGDRLKRTDILIFHKRLAGDPLLSLLPPAELPHPGYWDYVNAGSAGLYQEGIHLSLLELLKQRHSAKLVQEVCWALKAIFVGDPVCEVNRKHRRDTERNNKSIIDGAISEGQALTVVIESLKAEHESPECDPKTIDCLFVVLMCLSMSDLSNPILCATPFRQLMGSVLKRHKMHTDILKNSGSLNNSICGWLEKDNPRAADSYATQILNILIASLRMGIHTKDREVSTAALSAMLGLVKSDMSARLLNKKLHTLCIRTLKAFPEPESMTPAIQLLTVMNKGQDGDTQSVLLEAGVTKACRSVIGRYPKNSALVGTTLDLLLSFNCDSVLYAEGTVKFMLDAVIACPQNGRTTTLLLMVMTRVLMQAPESRAFFADPVTLTHLFRLGHTLDDAEWEAHDTLVYGILFNMLSLLYNKDPTCLQDLQDVVSVACKRHPEEIALSRLSILLETARVSDLPPATLVPYIDVEPVVAGNLSTLFEHHFMMGVANYRDNPPAEMYPELLGQIGFTTNELAFALPSQMRKTMQKDLKRGRNSFDPEGYSFGLCIECRDRPPSLSMRQPHLERLNPHRTLTLKATILWEPRHSFAMVGRTCIGTTEEDQVYAPTYAALITAHSLLPPLLVPGTPLSVVEQTWHNACRAHPSQAVGALVPYLSPYPVRPLWAVQMDEATLASELDGVVVDEAGGYIVASMLSGLHTERDRSED